MYMCISLSLYIYIYICICTLSILITICIILVIVIIRLFGICTCIKHTLSRIYTFVVEAGYWRCSNEAKARFTDGIGPP